MWKEIFGAITSEPVVISLDPDDVKNQYGEAFAKGIWNLSQAQLIEQLKPLCEAFNCRIMKDPRNGKLFITSGKLRQGNLEPVNLNQSLQE